MKIVQLCLIVFNVRCYSFAFNDIGTKHFKLWPHTNVILYAESSKTDGYVPAAHTHRKIWCELYEQLNRNSHDYWRHDTSSTVPQ